MILNSETFHNSSVDRPNRVRQWHHKTKSGCLNCKSRRIKCSEEKPACSKCTATGRECSYGSQPRARVFESNKREIPVSTTALTLIKPADYGTSDPEEVRALQFFLEVTAPAASTYNRHTKEFFSYLIPQVARTEAAVRHLAVAVATKQESLSSSNYNALALSRVQTKHYVAGLNALSLDQSKSEEVILLASALFLILGQLEPPEEQRAQSLFHLMAAMRILIERLKADDPKPSDIIETYMQPMYARLEMMMSIFMLPELGTEAVHCFVEPKEPVLPDQFGDLQEAQEVWTSICCWRYRKQALNGPWTADAPCFKEIRTFLLKWNTILMAYAGKAALASPHELQRTIAMISQFRILFVAMMFSVRQDLHLPDLVRPSFVNLLQPGEVSFTYHLPPRALAMIPELDWETAAYDDTFQVRLWPLVDVVKRSETAGLIRMTIKP